MMNVRDDALPDAEMGVRESEQLVAAQQRVVDEFERRGSKAEAEDARTVLAGFRTSLHMARARLRIERSVP
jgi:hypothetical protein